MNPSQALAVVLVDELVRGGMREAVLCPGSRNAPLSYALFDAGRAGRLRLHVRIDERTAGFLALGLARGSGAPVPVCCTSGTAAANLHPALVEADLSGVPVIALTADRPAHLRRTGASQTIDQVGLFGSAVRWAVDVPAPGAPGTGTGTTVLAGHGDNAAWRSLVCRVLDAAGGNRSGDPGPVQLNVGFTEPLVPVDATGGSAGNPAAFAGAQLPAELAGRPDGAPWTTLPVLLNRWSDATAPTAPTAPTVAARSPVERTSRTLVVLGDRADAAAAALATRAGYPVVAEASAWGTGGSGVLAAGPLLLGCPEFLDAASPDRVVVSGRPTLGRTVGALLTRPGVEVVVLAPGGGDWVDPQHAAHAVVDDLDLLDVAPVDLGWAATWRKADAAAAAARDSATAAGVQGAALARLVRDAAAVDDRQDSQPGLLICASSQAVRDLDTAGPVTGLEIVANRGAAGIDGTLSTATGMALAYQAVQSAGGPARPAGTPAFALVGDLAFLHDVTGLVIGPGEPRPDLTVVVADDDGGAIFATLEYGQPQYAAAFERVFGTPHGVDIPGICAGLRIPCASVDSADEVRTALADRSGGLRVVHVRTDRVGRRDRDVAVRSAVNGAVAAAVVG